MTLTASNSNPTLSFFGFTSDVAITSLQMSVNSASPSGNGSLVVDNFTFGQAVPEPSPWVLLSLGFCGLGLVVCRRNRFASANKNA